MTPYTNPRFQKAIEKAVEDWALADPARCAERAGCTATAEGVLVPFFGTRYLVSHPGGSVATSLPVGGDSEGPDPGAESATGRGKSAHVSIAILLLHYLLTADAAPEAGRWETFRELPDGLFYAQAFAAHAEAPLAAIWPQARAAARSPAESAGFARAARPSAAPTLTWPTRAAPAGAAARAGRGVAVEGRRRLPESGQDPSTGARTIICRRRISPAWGTGSRTSSCTVGRPAPRRFRISRRSTPPLQEDPRRS